MEALMSELQKKWIISEDTKRKVPKALQNLLEDDEHPNWLVRQVVANYELVHTKNPKLLALHEDGEEKSALKIVHVSDTHNYHRFLDLPHGDILIHSGDFCGNYGQGQVELKNQLLDFAFWLRREVSHKFRAIVLVSGNHDKPLESLAFRKHFVSLLPSNAVYLQDQAAIVLGLKIYGTPTCVCRKELKGKRYCSNAFEKKRELRESLFGKIPQDLDILITHMPPRSRLASRCASCDILAKYTKIVKPKIHCFGHDHDYLGIQLISLEERILCNAAQASLLQLQFRQYKKNKKRKIHVVWSSP
mmetsp:Transcript_19743/g.25566  ORF Transcript_19743/g.25566 Transcript_19743/m.25566 type:complete len:303 (-) Transcript_19743:1173-2081(-)